MDARSALVGPLNENGEGGIHPEETQAQDGSDTVGGLGLQYRCALNAGWSVLTAVTSCDAVTLN